MQDGAMQWPQPRKVGQLGKCLNHKMSDEWRSKDAQLTACFLLLTDAIYLLPPLHQNNAHTTFPKNITQLINIREEM